MRAGYRGMPSCGLLASCTSRGRTDPSRSRRPSRTAERVIHKPPGFRSFVLGTPPQPLLHCRQDHPGIDPRVGFGVGPHEPGRPVRQGHGGGHPLDLGCDDPRRGQRFPDHGCPVGFVIGEGLAGPLPRDEDTAAADTQVRPIMRRPLTPPRFQTRPGILRLDAVAEPVRATWRARQPAELGMQPVEVRKIAGSTSAWSSQCASAIALVRYFVRYRTARSASADGEMMPCISDCRPNRTTCAGSPSRSKPVDRLPPSGQHFARVGIAVVAGRPRPGAGLCRRAGRTTATTAAHTSPRSPASTTPVG